MNERHFTDDDKPIRVEITAVGGKGGLQDTGAGEKIKEISDDALFECFRAVYKVARKTERLIQDLHTADAENKTPLSGAEVQFGIKFDSGLNAVITSGLEATITVTLTWGTS
jgi:hypothetical protein